MSTQTFTEALKRLQRGESDSLCTRHKWPSKVSKPQNTKHENRLGISGEQEMGRRGSGQQGPMLLPRPGRRWEMGYESQRAHQNIALESKGERVGKACKGGCANHRSVRGKTLPHKTRTRKLVILPNVAIFGDRIDGEVINLK